MSKIWGKKEEKIKFQTRKYKPQYHPKIKIKHLKLKKIVSKMKRIFT
jgi:hypothetical protein